jgi:cell fate regulator YaaT (PSP1 superfamily)
MFIAQNSQEKDNFSPNAIERCIEENVLREFFMEHCSEVKVVQLEYTFDRQIMLEREEARTEGREAERPLQKAMVSFGVRLAAHVSNG